MDVAAILMGTVFVNNFVLVRFLGLCPFLGISKKLDGALGMGLATMFVLTLASALSTALSVLLLEPFDLMYLKIIVFILSIAAIVGVTEIVIKRVSPLLHEVLGVYLPLITTNCAVLGVALLNVNMGYSFAESVLFGFGASLGFLLVLLLFSSIRERLESADLPVPLRGNAIALVTAGLMSMGFMGFGGLV